MMNVDTKILCKVLATRIRPAMKHINHEDQCGFIPDRNTTMNLRRLAHVMREVEDREEEMALVSIGIAKVFDTVEW